MYAPNARTSIFAKEMLLNLKAHFETHAIILCNYGPIYVQGVYHRLPARELRQRTSLDGFFNR